jgi:aminoglycoside phosphotransferase (APT) family kinase protein
VITIPYGQTARRLEWHFLPPHIRAAVEERLGVPVIEAVNQPAGFTPGVACVLTGTDGRRVFVKAAAGVAQRAFAQAYLAEARILATLPAGVPAPALLWTIEDDWVVLGIEYVEGRSPQRPWSGSELGLCLDALDALDLSWSGVPDGLLLRPIAEEFAGFPAAWDAVRRAEPGLAHLEEAAALAGRMSSVIGGTGLVHTDLREDNLLLGPEGRVWLCDWNWPALGASWIDTVCLLIPAYGDGLDADALLAERRLTREVPAEDIDVFLALVAGYYLAQGTLAVPSSSPWLRAHQSWMAQATWSWLSARRGWTS